LHLVVGMGEVGSALYEVLEKHGFDVSGDDLDPAKCRNMPLEEPVGYVHICIPCGDEQKFIDAVSEIAMTFDYGNSMAFDAPTPIFIVHSTVFVGTTQKLREEGIDTVYSPIRGMHKGDFSKDIETYVAYLASYDDDLIRDVREELEEVFTYVVIDDPRQLEYMKITTLYHYALEIDYAKTVGEDCRREGWDYNRTMGMQRELRTVIKDDRGLRPILDPEPGPILGHCVMPGVRKLIAYRPPENDLMSGIVAIQLEIKNNWREKSCSEER